jgi:AraC-like DNA-binding protein
MKQIIQYEDELAVAVKVMEINTYPIHYHEDVQIIFVLEGELSLKLFYAKYRLQPGSIHIIHADDVHSLTRISEHNLVVVLSFCSEYFQSVFPHFTSTVFITNIVDNDTFSKSNILKDQIFAIIHEKYFASPGYHSRINNKAVALINTLMKNFRGFVIDPASKAFIHKTSHDYMQVTRISRIIQYVYENYPYKINLSQLAEREQISTYYLSHIFRKLVGMNFRDFLGMIRVEMSETAVLSTQRSIAQIAQDSGFSDAKYFVQQFYHYLGCHPKEYRNKYSSQILGALQPDINLFPLTHLQGIAERHTQYPIFKHQDNVMQTIEISFTDSPIASMKLPNAALLTLVNMASFLENQQIAASKSPSTLYQDLSPHAGILKLLQQLTDNPQNFRWPKLPLIDSADRQDGLFTICGLKKPVYYFVKLLSRLPSTVTNTGNYYIACCAPDEHCIIVYNESETDTMTCGIIAHDIKDNYRLVKYAMAADASCFTYWAQLNFTDQLLAEDREFIDSMSHPGISFDMVPIYETYHISEVIPPQGILILHFLSKKEPRTR